MNDYDDVNETRCAVAPHDDGISMLLWCAVVWVGGDSIEAGIDGEWFSMACGIFVFLLLLVKAVRTPYGSRVIKAPRCSCRKHAARVAKRGRS